MSESSIGRVVEEVAREFGRERWRLMDIARGVQQRLGCVNSQAMDAIASWLNISRVEVEGFVTFYSFLSKEPKGRIVIRLCIADHDTQFAYAAGEIAVHCERGAQPLAATA